MKTILKTAAIMIVGVILGCLIKTAAAKDSIGTRLSCQARLAFVHDEMGGHCIYMDEVMVGVISVNPYSVRCARVDVTCF